MWQPLNAHTAFFHSATALRVFSVKFPGKAEFSKALPASRKFPLRPVSGSIHETELLQATLNQRQGAFRSTPVGFAHTIHLASRLDDKKTYPPSCSRPWAENLISPRHPPTQICKYFQSQVELPIKSQCSENPSNFPKFIVPSDEKTATSYAALAETA